MLEIFNSKVSEMIQRKETVSDAMVAEAERPGGPELARV